MPPTEGACLPSVPLSTTQLVLIPSYNPGSRGIETVRRARARWAPVWVVVDGSDDGSAETLRALAASDPHLLVIVRPRNRGKGAALLAGMRAAQAAGFTHALTMDADGQHPAELIPSFMAASRAHPRAMILGAPVFDANAPRARVRGRRLCNWWVDVWTLWAGVDDSLFGFRVYPIAPLVDVMRRQPFMRRFDFDAEAVVRLYWRGVQPLNLPAPVRYFRADQDGVSHFRYLRDNALLTFMHARLLLAWLLRLAWLLPRRLRAIDGARA